MSVDALIRSVVATPVAVLLPFSGAWLGRPQVRLALVAALIAGAMSPYLGEWRGWAVLAGAALASGCAGGHGAGPWWRRLVCALAATVFAVVVTEPEAARSALESIGDSRAVTIVVAGLLASVFLAGALIGSLLGRFAPKVPDRLEGLEKAGTYIGWLERAILYMLFLAGAPDAAAIVIAGKSVARFPLFVKEEFAEYYLVGSLLSLGVAAAVGIGVRATLGLDPLVPTKL
jgi:hypothetical protein